MSRNEHDDDPIVVDFLIDFLADVESSCVRPLADYLQRYPGAEAEIAREYLALTREDDSGEAEEASDAASAAGLRTIARYEILRELGRGGQGSVYLAMDPRLKRRVALKVLETGGPRTDDMLLRFRREAEVASRLDHPGICTVYEVGTDRGSAYIAMRYVEGESLAERIRRAPAPPRTQVEIDEVVRLLETAARALHAAHEARVVHRDVKPGNIMIDGTGSPVIVDFGFARDDTGDMPTLTATGAVFGTPAYMSPEQISGLVRPLDRRTDVYSLGVSLYEALTHRLPFEAPTVQALAQQMRTMQPPDPRKLNPALSRDLAVVLETAFERDLARRYRTALDVADELGRVLRKEPIVARPAGPVVKTRRWAERNPVLATCLGVLVVVTGVLIAYLIQKNRDSVEKARLAESVATALQEKADLADDLLEISNVRRIELLLQQEEAELFPIEPGLVRRAEAWLDDVGEVMRTREKHEAALRRHRNKALPAADGGDAPPRFASDQDAWIDGVLSDLTGAYRRLATRVPFVRKRLERARTHRARCLDGAYAERWRACIAAIRESPCYGELELKPQMGLVPLGRSEQSGLWEFWHIESGDEPARAAGGWRVGDETGIIFVLLPPGRFTMGQIGDVPWGLDTAPVEDFEIDLALDAFFISKYEMTQAQWARADEGSNPSWYFPGSPRTGGAEVTLAHPVENVSWTAAAEVVARLGLSLPTEAQWEYACRGGTTTNWSTGAAPASLRGSCNLLGREQPRIRRYFTSPDFSDDEILHSPVGLFAPNPFGLHDVHGNVAEWCRDQLVREPDLVTPGAGDGLLVPPVPTGERMFRGGSAFKHAVHCRSASRFWSLPERPHRDVGVRPLRRLDR